MKCITEISLSHKKDFNAGDLLKARDQIKAKLDVAYCANRFGSINALDLFDEDYHGDIRDTSGRNHYAPHEIFNHEFSYMQLSSEKLECTKEISDKYRVCNLYDVDSFRIYHDTSGMKHTTVLKVVTDYAVDGSSIDAFNLTLKDIQQLNIVAQIATIDTILHMLSEHYGFNDSQAYFFTSHQKCVTQHNL